MPQRMIPLWAIKHCCMGPVLLSCCCLLVVLSFQNVMETYVELDIPTRWSRGTTVKTIVWFDFIGSGMRADAYTMDFKKCAKYKDCKFDFVLFKRGNDDTGAHKYMPLDGDAVLVESNRIWGIPPPPRRDSDQVFVMAEREAHDQLNPYMNNTAIATMWPTRVNWTMTYRLDSDIPYRHGSIRARRGGGPGQKKNYDEIFDAKSKESVMLVSNCKTKSKREEYVQILKIYSPVEVLGACGKPDVCPFNNTACLLELARQYKFNLAFENTFHTDFITEKFFSWFQRDLITVVRGGANYSKIAPPGTYINAADFGSPMELGIFLSELSKDRARYIEYLKRKDQYEVVGETSLAHDAYCTLCERLHTLEAHRKNYSHVGKWWIEGYYNFKTSIEGRDF